MAFASAAALHPRWGIDPASRGCASISPQGVATSAAGQTSWPSVGRLTAVTDDDHRVVRMTHQRGLSRPGQEEGADWYLLSEESSPSQNRQTQ